MRKISLPPNKDQVSPVPESQASSDRKIHAIINKGGKPSDQQPAAENVKRNINIQIYDKTLREINVQRDNHPKEPGRKIGKSLHAWILDAIFEKLERDKEAYT